MATPIAPLRMLARLSASAQPLKRPPTRTTHLRSPTWVCRRCIASGRSRKPSYLYADNANGEESWRTQRDYFAERHIGPSEDETSQMLKALHPEVSNMNDFIDKAIPADIRSSQGLEIKKEGSLRSEPEGVSEMEIHRYLAEMAASNRLVTSYVGCGYADTTTPQVIRRKILENPAWYTSYTPYQAEISQGRLESLLNFQTMVTDLTGLSIANASLLDEATAAAEAMTMAMNALPVSRQKKADKCFVVSEKCHPQTIAVLESRATGFGINIVVGDVLKDDSRLVKDQGENLMGVLVQYPDTEGGVFNFQELSEIIHQANASFCVATDLLALTLLTPPSEFGADIAFGNSQRFGVPLGYGGPHAAFFACGEKLKRKIPGRLIGVSKDRLGHKAMRLALQTREQHIRREKATSNVCTAQALLANMSAMYAIYHGPEGLRLQAQKLAAYAQVLAKAASRNGYTVATKGVGANGEILFDTVALESDDKRIEQLYQKAQDRNILLRRLSPTKIGISLHDVNLEQNFDNMIELFGARDQYDWQEELSKAKSSPIPKDLQRKTSFLTHPVFNSHHSETEMLRYIDHLESKDLSLVHSMIPLGSCTMKLNATSEMLPISFEGFSKIHPFTPISQVPGYMELIERLSTHLVSITGMDAISLQPNSGAQGEFAGLRVIKKYQESKNDGKDRKICLIPVSAHGTNPASAAMAGMKVVTLKCDTKTGNLDIQDLKEKCEKYKDDLAAIMVTYPSTFGVFEPEIKTVCDLVHEHGGQVYMDGANLNAQIGLCSPGEIGADVCHLNLHKTFCIPHGGGGPGVGPIACKSHLQPHLPGHPFVDPHFSSSNTEERKTTAISPVSAAPWGSASILPISLAYIELMGSRGLTHGTKIALLNANYIMSRLKPHYPILYTNSNGQCAHEFILDARGFKETAGIEAIDIAKRLQDYGFHAPTMSWPVANTLMIEPTESESKKELDRFCDALIQIRKEIKEIEDGKMPKDVNVLKMSPHPMQDLVRGDWERPYTREVAAYPLPWLKEKKFWPSVARVDDAYGDMNLFCSCTPVEGYEEEGFTGHQAPMPT